MKIGSNYTRADTDMSFDSIFTESTPFDVYGIIINEPLAMLRNFTNSYLVLSLGRQQQAWQHYNA